MMKSIIKQKYGFSMIELLVGVTIFGLAMVPLMWMSSRNTSQTYSVGKHMMAGQVAASVLDRLIALPYTDFCKKTRELIAYNKKKSMGSDKAKIMDDKDFQGLLKSIKNKEVEKDMKRSFRYFRYKITLNEDKKTKTARIDVTVFYRVSEGNEKSEQSVQLSAIKYGVING